jgi:ABC-type polysaccharide/polyol phosphate export permease
VSTSVSAASESLTGDASLVTKVYFPRLAAPIAACLAALVDLGVAVIVLVPLMIVGGVAPTITLVALPLCVLGLLLVALSVGLWLAVLNAQYRDVRYTLGLFMQLWLFASPVGYPASLVHGWWRWLYALNPMSGALSALRWSLAGAPWPGPEMAVSAFAALVVLAGALVWFQRSERLVADII